MREACEWCQGTTDLVAIQTLRGRQVMCTSCRCRAWPELRDQRWVEGNPRAAKALMGEPIT